MADGGALINLGDLSKPATVLLEKVCNAVGIIYEPTRIKRMARAEAEVEKIKAVVRIELSDIEQRSLERFVHQETRKQENIEQITLEAAVALLDSANVEKLEEDWIAYFFKQCDTVTDKKMQSLWARLLAYEATTPSTFSKRTVNFVSSIDKSDADLFTAFCKFVWVLDDEMCPIIYDIQNKIYEKHGITFASLKHLDSIGLISLESLTNYVRKITKDYAQLSYYDQSIIISFNGNLAKEIDIGHALLTATGKELAQICGSTKDDSFYKYVIGTWSQRGLTLSPPP